jgi:acyl carrier protein
MNKSDFLVLVDELVEVEPGTLKGPETLSSVEGWNSMAVIGFIAMVDERFGFTPQAKLLAECKTVDDLVRIVGDRVIA